MTDNIENDACFSLSQMWIKYSLEHLITAATITETSFLTQTGTDNQSGTCATRLNVFLTLVKQENIGY